MNSLKSVVSKYSSSLNLLGSETNNETEKTEEKGRLVEELLKIKSKNAVFFWICVSMLIAMFLGAFFLFYKFYNDTDKLKTLFGISGISITGLLYYMNRLWKEKTALDMLIILASSFKPETVNTILAVILKKYF